MKKHKNEEHSRLPKLIMEAAMFLKMQNFFEQYGSPFQHTDVGLKQSFLEQNQSCLSPLKQTTKLYLKNIQNFATQT